MVDLGLHANVAISSRYFEIGYVDIDIGYVIKPCNTIY
jgi:hypothetical protein